MLVPLSLQKQKRRSRRLLYQGTLDPDHIYSKWIVQINLRLKRFHAYGHVKLSGSGLSIMGASTGLRWRAPECLKR
jgi:hypothetical protein